MLAYQLSTAYHRVSGAYLLAFVREGQHVPYGVGRRGLALHYLGWAADIGRRLAEHQSGQGACLTRAVVRAGYQLHVVRIWPGATRTDERQLKGAHNAARHCPWCALNLAPLPDPEPVVVCLL